VGLCALALAAGPVTGAGFSIFEQGSKAMGTAGAFTALADDGSAMFHNAAGIAFQESSFAVGATFITFGEAEFEGGSPFPGTGFDGEQKSLVETPPHAYWVKKMGDRGAFGIGLMSPFGLTTEWDHPESFSGRYLSTKAGLRAIDFNPTYAFKVSDTMSVGIGAIVRYSDVELERFVGQVNPFTLRVADVATARIESDFSEGYGFNVGFLHRWNNSFSWGLSYRSKIEIDYEGGRASSRC
jgi:long-chain fatty acid transport protein